VRLSAETFALVAHAEAAWRHTDGGFDPTVLDSLINLGYDADLAEVLARPAAAAALRHPVPAPGCAGIVLDPEESTVMLPRGVHLDPGGIGKGLAGDLIVDALMTFGAAGVMVDVGGDVVVAGDSPEGAGWTIGIEHPLRPGVVAATVTLHAGAVATSTTARRTWLLGNRPVHHLVDPSTGEPLPAGAATVIAGAGWWAEVLTKSVLVHGPAALPAGCAALVAGPDGHLERHGLIEAIQFREAA
jgi:thiamine biosynthesis lipoprotein